MLSKSKTADLGRAALWAAVDAYHAEMLEGEFFILLDGSREVLTVRIAERREIEIKRSPID